MYLRVSWHGFNSGGHEVNYSCRRLHPGAGAGRGLQDYNGLLHSGRRARSEQDAAGHERGAACGQSFGACRNVWICIRQASQLRTIMKMIKKMLPLLAVLSFAALGNCCAGADEHATFKVEEFTFTRPAKWEWTETTSSMRKAELKVKDADGKATAQVVFFQFNSGAGTVQANVDRWLAKFQEPREKINSKVEEATVGKTKVTYVQAEGTYNDAMPGSPPTTLPDYALMGAIVPSSDGDVYVRMTGPKALVKASGVEFKKMIESGLKK